MIPRGHRGDRYVLPVGLAILLTGILIGSLADPLSWIQSASPSGAEMNGRPSSLQAPHLQHRPHPPEIEDNGLITLHLDIDPEYAKVIQAVYDRAIERSQIVQEPGDTVPAILRCREERFQAEVRIKGDLVDHVRTDKWSFRIRLLDGKFHGMSVFSIQNPITRGYLWEWFVLEAAHREDLLAPRCRFVNMVINNNPLGIYYLEEHFSKELIESQGRRDGPIVLFDEKSFWALYLQNHITALGIPGAAPVPLKPAGESPRAPVRAYGPRRLAKVETLNRGMLGALEKIQDLQKLMTMERTDVGRLEKLQALAKLGGETIERFMDVELWAKAHALASVLQIRHGLIWHNLRLYFNPITDRLEPTVFDCMAHFAPLRDPVVFIPDDYIQALARSPAYLASFYKYLGAYCESDYLEKLFADLEPAALKIQSALDQEEKLLGRFRFDAMKQRLRNQQIYLKNMLYPHDPINFVCSFEKEKAEGSTIEGTLEVHAWSTTEIPPVLEGFKFSNGSFIAAQSCLDPSGPPAAREGRGVMLPPGGLRIKFRFPANPRLMNLSNIQELKQGIRAGQRDSGGVRLDEVKAVYRMLAGGGMREEVLTFFPYERTWIVEEGRPEPPGLAEALERHPFLLYNMNTDKLEVRRGEWDVEGDLILPRDYTLHVPSNVTLRFDEEAVLVAVSPLIFRGKASEPIVLEPKGGKPSWRGIVVLNTGGRSEWQHVRVRNTNSIARKGWTTTGGITFYHAPVTLMDCLIDGTLAEDGLNVFGCDLLMEKVTFRGCASDSFDGDFVTGAVRSCVFRNGAADGADFSGSDVIVEGCTFIDLGDKGLSVGEKTRCKVTACRADRVSIGLASKDLSEVEVKNFAFGEVKHYAVAVYVKKPEYGPSRVTIQGLEISENVKNPFLVQEGCELIVDGEKIPTKAIDVERLYEQKILGN
ncbi:MAG: right-handed parallel beta-helix repeat-containing protein [Planctomycetota bacterium]|jgi:hypothetical protein